MQKGKPSDTNLAFSWSKKHFPLDASFLCQYFKSTLRRKVFILKWFFRLPVWATKLGHGSSVEWRMMVYISRLPDSLFDRKKMMYSCVAPKAKRRKIHIRALSKHARQKGEEAGSGSWLASFHIKREFVFFFSNESEWKKKVFDDVGVSLSSNLEMIPSESFCTIPTQKRQNRPVIRPVL